MSARHKHRFNNEGFCMDYDGCGLHKDEYAEILEEEGSELETELHDLRSACQALFDAPHQEHFVTRLNDEENAALERIRKLARR